VLVLDTSNLGILYLLTHSRFGQKAVLNRNIRQAAEYAGRYRPEGGEQNKQAEDNRTYDMLSPFDSGGW
jgi:hypothetical protein